MTSTAYDPRTGKLSHGLAAPTEPLVPMLGPGGVERQVPQSQAKLFADVGYTIDTPEARREMELQQQYGEGLGNELLAALAGGARTLSFGLSDLALTETGLTTSRTLDELRKRNPDATLAGELGAFFVPGIGQALTAARGVGAATKAAGLGLKLSGAGISGVSKLGNAIGSVAAKTTGSTLLGSAAQAAAESLAFNVAHNLSESVLGDKQITAERLLANSGQALLVGGGLGFGIPLAGRAAAASAKKAKQALDEFGATLKNTILPKVGDAAASGYAKGFAAATGGGEAAEKEIVGMLSGTFTPTGAAKREDIIRAISNEAFDDTVRTFTNNLDDVHKSVNQAIKRGFNEIKPREVTKLLKDVDMQPALEDVGRLINTTAATAKKLADDPLLYDQTLRRELETIVEQLEQRVGSARGGAKIGFKSAEDIWTTIDQIKSSAIADISKKPAGAGRATLNAIREIQGVYGEFKAHLENPQLYGELAAKQAARNEAFSAYQKLVEKRNTFTGKAGEFRREFLDGNGNVSADKALAYLRKLGAARDRAELRALGDWMTASQTLVQAIDDSARGVGADINREGFESLMRKLIDTQNKASADLAFVSKVRQQDVFGMALLNFQKSVGEHLATGGIFNATIKLAEKAASPFGVVRALSAAEGFVLNTAGRISGAVDRFATRAAKAGAGAATKARPYVEPASISALMNWLAGLAMGKVGELDEEKEQEPRTRREAFEQAQDKLAALAADPAGTAAALADGVQHLSPHAPETAQALIETQLRAVAFLHEKMPKDPDSQPSPFSPRWQPSDSEISTFERYADAVQNPLGVLDDLEAGTVTQEQVETLQAVYPSIYEELKAQLIERAAQLQGTLPYRDRLQLSLLFDVALDPSLDPSFVSAVQKSYGQPAAQESRPASSPTSARSKLGALEETPAQRIARR